MSTPGGATRSLTSGAELRSRAVDVLRRARRQDDLGEGRLVSALKRLGYDARPVLAESLEVSPERILWFRGNPSWFPAAIDRLASIPPERRPAVVVWHSEPLPFPRAAGLQLERLHARELAKIALRDARATDPYTNIRGLRRMAEAGLIDLLAVSTRAGQEVLAEHGVEAEFAPLGYRPEHGRDLGLERDIDVLFLGSLDVPRRRRIFRGLRRDGVDVHAVGAWNDPRYWGEERTRLLNRTRILLNLPRHAGLLSGMRMILGMANKALVISEPVYRPEPYREGVHYLSATPDEMPEVIARALVDGEARRRMTDDAYRFVTEELTFDRSAATIMRLLERRLGRDAA